MIEEAPYPTRVVWQKALDLLSTLESGQASIFPRDEEDARIRYRTETLAILFDILPRSEIGRLPSIVGSWFREFGYKSDVTLDQLRRVARDTFADRHTVSDAENLWRKASLLSNWNTDPKSLYERSRVQFRGLPPEASEYCAIGIHRWLLELKRSSYWNTIPGAASGETSYPLSEIYVELFAVDESEAINFQNDYCVSVNRPQQGGSSRCSSIGIESMISRTIEQCVVIGDPGSGKSTLVKWLVWATFNEKLIDFDLAIAVKLSAYAAALAIEPTLSPIEFFFRTMELTVDEAKLAAAHIREVGHSSQRYLLLLDGWDEVPLNQRERVKVQLLTKCSGFITVVTSRPSGLPRQLVEHALIGCYRIAGLTPQMAENLTAKLLLQIGKYEDRVLIWERIQRDHELREMATNPFLLSLLVRALLDPTENGIGTRAIVYRRITAWMRDQYESDRMAIVPLSMQHMDGLGKLSFRLLSERNAPRYVFSRRELESCVQIGDAEPLLLSRFVTKPIAAFDEFVLAHATIQEYFAAEHIATGSEEQHHGFASWAFLSLSRFSVLEFLSGLGGTASNHCEQLARMWWQSRDRFQQITRKIAKLAVAGRWSLGDWGKEIRNELWKQVCDASDMELCSSAVQIFSELDAADLIRRSHERPPSNWALDCMLNSIPSAIARSERLYDLLDGEWRDVACVGEEQDEQREIKLIQDYLSDRIIPQSDLREAVLRVGVSDNKSAILLLKGVVLDESVGSLIREEAASSIGKIGGVEATIVLVDLLLCGSDLTNDIVRMVATRLARSVGQRLELDPRGRDRILRRLTAISESNPHVSDYLTALDGFPIRDGANVIAELATSRLAGIEVQRKAITVLTMITDRRLLTQLLTKIEDANPELIVDWLKLALERSLPISLSWLEKRIGRSRDRTQRDQLLRALFEAVAQCSSGDKRSHIAFLERLVVSAFTNTTSTRELALALVSALSQIQSHLVVLFPRKTLVLTRKLLNQSAAREGELLEEQVLLAIALVRHFRDATCTDVLVRIIEQLRVKEQRGRKNQVALAIAECLAELAPRELLRLSQDCPEVTAVLKSRSVNLGWLVFADRILSAEGVEIATVIVEKTTMVVDRGQGDGLLSIFQGVPPRMRQVLQSYWLMVRNGGPCHPNDSLPSIYLTAKTIYDGTDDSEIGRILRDIFTSAFPKFDAWTRQLNRVEKKFANDLSAVSLLQTLGLFRRQVL